MRKTSPGKHVSAKIDEALGGVNTCRICKIIDIDMNLYKADVVPLDDPDATPILDVPIAFHQTEHFVIQVPYKVWDIVLVVCAQSDIDPLMFGGGEAASRAFSENDALIVGGVNYFTKPLENPHPEDVVISDKVFKNKIRIQPDGEIFIESENQITAVAPTIHFNP